MITYVTSKNLDKYTKLFDKATQALHKEGVLPADESINGLSDYFSLIRTLTDLDNHYAILPLDEDIFEIDANTRTINVPKNFQNNGISVQGDEVSEILYFKINRYFDAIDFDECQIFIEWENAPDVSGQTDKGVSKEWIRDIDTYPDYLVFGWPVSSTVTKRPGTIKFAVRIYKPTDPTDLTKGLDYSFSTLTASAVIKPALDFSIDTEAIPPQEDLTNLVRNRIKNSENTPEGEAPIPTYFSNWNLPDEAKNADIETILAVQAYAEAGGSISYKWKFLAPKEAKKPSEATKDIVVYDSVADYRKVPASESRVAGKIYYYKITEGVYRYWDGDVPSADGTQIFEKVGTLTARKCGAYFAEATNRTGLKTVSEPLASNTLILLKKPVVNNPLPVRINNLAESAVINSDIIADLATDEGAERESANAELLDFVWTRTIKDAQGRDVVTELEDKTASITVAEGGRYSLKVRNALTLGSGAKSSATDYVEAGMCRVTKPAETPVFDITGLDDEDEKIVHIGHTVGIVVTNLHVDNDFSSDAITYQWYRKKSSGDTKLTGETASTFKPTDDGKYYVIVTNTLNEDVKEAQSAFITAE